MSHDDVEVLAQEIATTEGISISGRWRQHGSSCGAWSTTPRRGTRGWPRGTTRGLPTSAAVWRGLGQPGPTPAARGRSAQPSSSWPRAGSPARGGHARADHRRRQPVLRRKGSEEQRSTKQPAARPLTGGLRHRVKSVQLCDTPSIAVSERRGRRACSAPHKAARRVPLHTSRAASHNGGVMTTKHSTQEAATFAQERATRDPFYEDLLTAIDHLIYAVPCREEHTPS
jgi:hypothetical protein